MSTFILSSAAGEHELVSNTRTTFSAVTSKPESLDTEAYTPLFDSKESSDNLINYFLVGYFVLGLVFAAFYDTWLTALGLGSTLLLAYYTAKYALVNSNLYQYVLSSVLGIFMAQFIYQMHGMFEMHFFAFIGSAILITYQKWKLQIPIFIVVILHHALLGYLHNKGYSEIYFSQLKDFDLQTFVIHLILAAIIFFICGLWAYQLKKFNEKQISQTLQMAELQKKALLSKQRKQHGKERETILESIGDAFFAVDKNWVVTYWNSVAEKVLRKKKSEIINRNLWEEFSNSINSLSYKKYHEAIKTNRPVHFEDYYTPLDKWYEISAYPSDKGLSVYFIDITGRKQSEILLKASEKKYSELFHLSPLPMFIFDVDTLEFLNVNSAALKNYGYTLDEFLKMTLKDIRPVEDMYLLDNNITRFRAEPDFTVTGVFRHKRKNGDVIQVDIHSYNIPYKGKQAKVILAEDVTERLNYISAIEEQNEKLREISWMQSHVIRAPLARIMGLIPLIENHSDDVEEKEKMMEYMLISAHELDDVIRNISEKTGIDE
jgi:PAS domain S-box-containing protein